MTWKKNKTQDKRNHILMENYKLKQRWYKTFIYIIYYVINSFELYASCAELQNHYSKIEFMSVFLNLKLTILFVLGLEFLIVGSIKSKKEFIMKFFDIFFMINVFFFTFLYLYDIIDMLIGTIEITLNYFINNNELFWYNLFITTFLAVTGIIIMLSMNIKLLFSKKLHESTEITKKLVTLILCETFIFFIAYIISFKYLNFKTSMIYYLINFSIYLSIIIFVVFLIGKNIDEEESMKFKIIYVLFLKFNMLFFVFHQLVIESVEKYLAKKMIDEYNPAS